MRLTRNSPRSALAHLPMPPRILSRPRTHFPFRYRCLLALGLFQPALAVSLQAQGQQSPFEVKVESPISNFGGLPLETPSPPAGNYQSAKVLSRGSAAYPTLADLNRVEGLVTLRFYIDETGHVIKTAVVKSASPMLETLALEPSLRQWTFQPATLNGKPVPATHDQEFEFRLDPGEQKKLALQRLALPIGTPDPPYPPAAAASHLQGSATISVQWTKQGLVDHIGLVKSSGVPFLDTTALRFAYGNWRIDPAAPSPDQPFVKTIKFAPPS